MTGFVPTSRRVADLNPGDRVRWFDTSRVVQSVRPADDGSGHLIVTFDHAPAARYAAGAELFVIEVTAGGEAE